MSSNFKIYSERCTYTLSSARGFGGVQPLLHLCPRCLLNNVTLYCAPDSKGRCLRLINGPSEHVPSTPLQIVLLHPINLSVM